MRTIAIAFALVIAALTTSARAQTFQIQQNDFKSLYNSVRFAQPDIVPWAGSFFSYGQDGTAIKAGLNGRSPMAALDTLAGNQNGEAEKWETSHHSCSVVPADQRASCMSWWGHCNGWTGAAIKEPEPREDLVVDGQRLTVAEQKGILTETWLSANALFSGGTEKSMKTGPWVNDHAHPTAAYQKFWDVTPKSLFLIFTNYVGVMKMGVAIDRFTGDEVWNQPVIGYRVLPIRPTDIRPVTDRGVTYWTVSMRMKIYWANDSGVPAGHVSAPFSITQQTSDSELVENFPYTGSVMNYSGRLLRFRLNFDGEVKVSPDGMQILEAGRIVGDGVWDHQEKSSQYSFDQLNHTHPDFIWLPTNAIQDFNGYGNPYMVPTAVAKARKAPAPPPEPAAPKRPPLQAGQYRIVVPAAMVQNERADMSFEERLLSVFAAEGIRADVHMSGVIFEGGKAFVPITLTDMPNRDLAKSRLSAIPFVERVE